MLKSIVVNMSMGAILPGRTVLVKAVTILDEYDVVRLEYEVAPANDPSPVGGSEVDWAAWYAQNAWQAFARDDVGTKYDDFGGAVGLSSDGARTQGEFDFHPAPPSTARWLELTFGRYDTTDGADRVRYTLRLVLPLDGASFTRS